MTALRPRQLSLTTGALRAWRHAPLAALILLAVYPVLAGGLPTTGDGLNHFYRLAELDWHVRHGDLYPRWFANMHYGFGAPVLNFYAPLSYYVPLLFRLLNLPLAICLQLSYAAALTAGIVGAYRWAAELKPSDPLVVAAAYGLAPYFYFNIFHRGAYPETWALALAPWLLWAAHRAVRQPGLNQQVCLALLAAALVLTHTLSAFIVMPAAALYVLALVRLHHASRREVLRLTLFMLLALALTAFFTLPLLLESQHIQLSRTYAAGDLDYRNNFLDLAGLLSPPASYDPNLVFNVMPASLGWPQAGLGVLAAGAALLAVARRRRTPPAGLALLLAALCLLLSALSLAFSAPLWAAFPAARFIQFPWRLVGPASLFLAGLAGMAVKPGPDEPPLWHQFLPPAACLLFFFFSLPWTYHAVFDAPRHSGPLDTVRYEVESGQMGTASTAEYLPVWVETLPHPESVPYERFGHIPPRLVQPPGGVEFTVTRLGLTDETVSFQSPTGFTATFHRFYFPGWQAALDGRPAPIQVEPGTGLLSVQVPAGQHTLRVALQPTAPQIAGSLISIAALLGTVALLGVHHRAPAAAAAGSPPGLTLYGSRVTLLAALLPLALILTRIVYLDRVETIFHHSRGDDLPNPSAVNFDSELELIGFEYAPRAVSGGPLPVALYWRALRPPSEDYAVSVQLADRAGNRFGQSDSQHPNGVPTSRWSPDQYARDVHTLIALDGTPPGTYQLRVTVYADRPLSLLENGAPAGVAYVLGTVTIARAAPQPPGPLRLLSFDLANDSAQVGERLEMTLLWHSGERPPPGLAATLALTAPDGQTLFRSDLPPAGPDYPSERWASHERIRYPLALTLPPDLPGGPARLWVSLTDAGGGVAAGPFDLGPVLIRVPERSFDIPPMQVRVDHDFGGAIRLLGYDLDGESITLYWQSLETLPVGLTVFVHALGPDGSFLAGHDAAPGRPTPGWLPGEVIADRHPIAIADRFEVGLYEPLSGERFGETFVTRR